MSLFYASGPTILDLLVVHSVVSDSATPWTAAHQASLSITNLLSLLTLVHQVSDAIQPSHPLSSPSPPVLNLSQHQGLFQWVSSLHQMKYWSFHISPSSEYSGLISFRIDWFDLLAVQATLKSLLQIYDWMFWTHESINSPFDFLVMAVF